MFGIFAALAEFERELIRERTVAGLEAARARRRKGGRKYDPDLSALSGRSEFVAPPRVWLVLACSDCPKSRPSQRREPRWSVVARTVAQALDAPAAEVRSIVRAAGQPHDAGLAAPAPASAQARSKSR